MKKFLLISALLSTAFLAGCGTTNSVQPQANPTGQEPQVKPIDQQLETKTTGQTPQITACTMDAKACPDGSYVGRTGPNCEFAACPAASTSEIATEKTGGNYSCGITPDPNCEAGK
jgi:outer membrane murein-binding lipoprotein Lpp